MALRGCPLSFRDLNYHISTVVVGEGFFFDTKILFFLNIFWSTCRMSLIFSPTDSPMLGVYSRYLERWYISWKKFSRAIQNQLFPWKCMFWNSSSGIFWCFKPLKNPIFVLLRKYFFDLPVVWVWFFHGRIDLCSDYILDTLNVTISCEKIF